MLLSFFSERERLKTGDTNVVKVSFPKREGLKTGNAWAIQMLLSCFSERERLKLGNFFLCWGQDMSMYGQDLFHVYSQTLITCWRLQQCQCLINGNGLITQKDGPKIYRLLKVGFSRPVLTAAPKKSCIRLSGKDILVQWRSNPIWNWLCIWAQR